MERLGDEVRRSLRGAGVQDAGVLADVTRVWASAVGPGIAAAAWPARIGRDQTLHVHAASSVWAFELARLEDEIRGRLAGALPGAEPPPRLRFAVGPVPAAGAPAAEPGERRAPTPDAHALRLAEEIASTVDDDRLRELVRRAAAASLSTHPDDRPVW